VALELSYDDEFGNTNASAYHRITSLLMYLLDGSRVKIEVSTFKDVAASGDGNRKLRTLVYGVDGTDYDTYFAPAVLDVVDQNPQERAYVYLKTLDEWDGASDV